MYELNLFHKPFAIAGHKSTKSEKNKCFQCVKALTELVLMRNIHFWAYLFLKREKISIISHKENDPKPERS